MQYNLCLQVARDGSHPTPYSSNGSSSSSGLSAAPVTMNVTESKIQYIRHMVYQYLSCRDAEVGYGTSCVSLRKSISLMCCVALSLQVRLHIESALIAIFRLNEQERSAIEVKRKEEAQDTFTTITSFLGEAFSLSTN